MWVLRVSEEYIDTLTCKGSAVVAQARPIKVPGVETEGEDGALLGTAETAPEEVVPPPSSLDRHISMAASAPATEMPSIEKVTNSFPHPLLLPLLHKAFSCKCWIQAELEVAIAMLGMYYAFAPAMHYSRIHGSPLLPGSLICFQVFA